MNQGCLTSCPSSTPPSRTATTGLAGYQGCHVVMCCLCPIQVGIRQATHGMTTHCIALAHARTRGVSEASSPPLRWTRRIMTPCISQESSQTDSILHSTFTRADGATAAAQLIIDERCSNYILYVVLYVRLLVHPCT